MATFHLRNFGCRVSQADGAALKKQLLQAGLEESAVAERSDVVVLNTCTVTASADAEVRQVVRRIHRANPGCRILVTGCYAQRAPEEIAPLEGVAWVVGNSHKHFLTEILRIGIGDQGPGLGTGQPVPNPEPLTRGSHAQVLVGEISDQFHFAPVFADDRTRPTLKVQDGCDARCSFCVIPSVRGPSRSLAPEKVIEQVLELERNGYQEIVLSGINLGRYGRDLDRRINFLGLVEKILVETSIARLRISSIEPMDISPELIRLAGSEPRLADHFHVPLQSGSDRILRLMNRRYWTAQYAERTRAIREALPHAAIGADVMVGFPGETAEDHAASARFIESLPFTYLHIFPYSPRPGTPAASRPGQVDGRVAHERGQELRNLIAWKRQAFLESQIGRTLSALTLGAQADGLPLALSSNYLKVALAASAPPGPAQGSDVTPNTLLDVRVARTCNGLLYGIKES